MQNSTMKAGGLLILLLTVAPFNANAEIHKEAVLRPKTGKICFYWWPKLPEVAGWKQDKNSSYEYAINAQSPVNSNFSNAETVIYAKAVYKASQPESKNLNSFIQNDQAAFKGDYPGIRIDAIPPIQTSNGLQLKLFSFKPKGKGNWEEVAYGEEKDDEGKDYFLTFVISSRTKTGFAKNLKAYRQFISNYK